MEMLKRQQKIQSSKHQNKFTAVGRTTAIKLPEGMRLLRPKTAKLEVELNPNVSHNFVVQKLHNVNPQSERDGPFFQ